ncbi:MAG: hypothetical protein Q4C63_03450 [Eubacteriales bacterium]|nr:hypothetical protein [Eubacteriales bacterium]
MRKEATLEEWAKLYETASRIRELEPWKLFWDLDIIGIRTGDVPEETAFCSILGRGGGCYGIVVYEGYEAFNGFMMMTMQDRLNLSLEYVMANQRNLTCYWGNRAELSEKQRKTIKELGYQYQGRNSWLYFMSYEPGYSPYNMDQDEVLRMTEHLEHLEKAVVYYKESAMQIDFEHGAMLSAVYSAEEETWSYREEPLPFASFHLGNLMITDDELLDDLKKVPRTQMILEADVRITGVEIRDKSYDKPGRPSASILVESVSGMAIACELNSPETDANVCLAEAVIGVIFRMGAPKEIRVSNIIIESVLEQICEVCNIKLKRVKRLSAIDEFLEMMDRYQS